MHLSVSQSLSIGFGSVCLINVLCAISLLWLFWPISTFCACLGLADTPNASLFTLLLQEKNNATCQRGRISIKPPDLQPTTRHCTVRKIKKTGQHWTYFNQGIVSLARHNIYSSKYFIYFHALLLRKLFPARSVHLISQLLNMTGSNLPLESCHTKTGPTVVDIAIPKLAIQTVILVLILICFHMQRTLVTYWAQVWRAFSYPL